MNNALAPINPVQVFPSTADTLKVDSFYGLPPSYRWELAKKTVTPGTPEVPAVGQPGDLNYQPAIPATPDTITYERQKDGNAAITQAQWDAWTTQPDETYILQCVAANLGVTLR